MTNENRRKAKRIACQIPCVIKVKNEAQKRHTGELLDISLFGAFIHCTIPILIGEEVIVEVDFGKIMSFEAKVTDYEELIKKMIPKELPVRSVVKWARGTSNSGFGVEFVELSKEQSEFLNGLMNQSSS